MVVQPGSGFTRLFEEIGKSRPAPSLCLLRDIDRIGPDGYTAYQEYVRAPEPPRLLIATASDPSFPHPFTDARPANLLIVTDEDLAFTREDIESLFHLNGIEIPSNAVQRIYHMTGGWAAGVGHAVRVWGTDGEYAACDPCAHPYRAARAFVYERVLSQLSPDELALLVTAVAIQEPHAEVLRSALPACNVEVALAGLLQRRLILRREDGLNVSGLVAAAVREYYRGDFRKLMRTIAEDLASNANFFAAACVALAARDQLSAIEYLLLMRFEEVLACGAKFHRIVRMLPETVICAHPKLWISAIQSRRYSVNINVMLSEARMLIEAFENVEETSVMRLLRSILYVGLCEAGAFEQAGELLPLFDTGASASSADLIVEAMIAGNLAAVQSDMGNDEEAAKHLRAVAPLLGVSPALRALLMHIHVRKMRMRGEWYAERVFVERAVEAAAESDEPCAVAMALFHGAFGAALAGDRTALDEYMERLRGLDDTPATAPFCALARVSIDCSEAPGLSFGLPRMRGAAHIIRSAYSGSPQEARSHITAALQEFDASSYLFGRIVARVAMAQIVPHRQDELIAQARTLAKGLKCQALMGALSHLAIGELPAPHQPLRRFAEELRKLRLTASEPIAIDVLSGCIRRDGRPIDGSQRVMLLLAALQVRRRPLSREELCEMLWPDEDAGAAGNALKMTVRRARLQSGDPQVIEWKNNAYTLGAHVHVESDRVRYACESALRDMGSAAKDSGTLYAMYRALAAGRPPYLLENEWFAGTEAMLVNLQMELGSALARDMIARGDYSTGPDLAHMMLECDPCDETAWELLIRADLARGAREAAKRTLREYRRNLQAQLQTPISPRLEELLA